MRRSVVQVAVLRGVLTLAVLTLDEASSPSTSVRAENHLPTEFLYTLPTSRSGPGTFWNAYSLDVGPDGTVYVVDASNHRVQMFASDGEYLGQWGELGREEGRFGSLVGLRALRGGTVLVADSATGPADDMRIQRFDGRGRFVGYGSPWEFGAQSPDGMSWYTLSFYDGTVSRYDARGRLLTTWGKVGTGPGEFREPSGLVVAADGSVIVADSLNHRLQQFTADGRFMRTWGKSGRGSGEFRGYLWLALAGPGELLVLDRDDRSYAETRLQRFTVAGEFLAEVPIPNLGGAPIINDMATAADGSIYLMWQWPGWVVHLEPDGTLRNRWGEMEGPSHATASGISSTPGGDILVESRGEVLVLGRLGELKSTVAYARILGLDSEAAVTEPVAAPGAAGSVWVIGGERHYRSLKDSTLSLDVARIGSDGEVRARWPLGPYDEPGQLAQDPTLTDSHDGGVIVVDRERRRIHRLDSEGRLALEWSLPEAVPSFAEYLRVDVALDGSTYLLQFWKDPRAASAPPPPRVTR